MRKITVQQVVKEALADSDLPVAYNVEDPQTGEVIAIVEIRPVITSGGLRKHAFEQLSDVSFFSPGGPCPTCSGCGRVLSFSYSLACRSQTCNLPKIDTKATVSGYSKTLKICSRTSKRKPKI